MANEKTTANEIESHGNNTASVNSTGKGQHKATYQKDRHNPGKYLVRVVGPRADEFEGKEIPVTRANAETQTEKLLSPVWKGMDDGKVIASDKGKMVCLYHFEQKPREYVEPEF